MLCSRNAFQETLYDILSVRENASHEEIRTSYRSAILNCHPDKLHNTHSQTLGPQSESENRFLKVKKAWEILGNSKSRALYDSELRALRQDSGVAEDLSLEDMTAEDSGEALELFYQCRCGDYFSIDSLELEKLGYTTFKDDESKMFFGTPDALPSSIVLPCGSCSLQVRLLINPDVKVPVDGSL